MNDHPSGVAGPFDIRDAADADLDELQAMGGTRAMHVDRIREAQLGWMHYLVGVARGRVVGNGMIYYTAMPGWDHPEHVPLVVALYVRPDLRSRGIGTSLIGQMAGRAARRGFRAMYLRVEPENNPRAFGLYRRLGFEALQSEPFRDPYHFVDSEGNLHEGVEWNVEMVKRLDRGVDTGTR